MGLGRKCHTPSTPSGMDTCSLCWKVEEQGLGDPTAKLGPGEGGGGGTGHLQGQGSLATPGPGAGEEAFLPEDKVSKRRIQPSTTSHNFGARGFLKFQTNCINTFFGRYCSFSQGGVTVWGYSKDVNKFFFHGNPLPYIGGAEVTCSEGDIQKVRRKCKCYLSPGTSCLSFFF